MKSVKEATISSAKWGAIEKFSIQGIRFILGLIMARLLSPTDYGQISLIMLFIVISDVLVDSGFTNALIRKSNHVKQDFSTAFYFNFGIAVLCYVILFLISPWIAEFFNVPILKPLIRVQAISIIINSLVAVQLAMLTIKLDFKAIAKCNMTASIVSGIVGVVLAYIGLGVWALVWQTITASIITLICVCLICKWLPLAGFSKSSFRSMFSYGSKLLASSLINKVYQNLSTIIIGRFYSAKVLGNYDRGASLAAFPADNINTIIQKITFPIMAKIQDDEERLIHIYKKYIQILSMVIFFSCILLASIAKPLIGLILSSKWSGAIIFMQIYTFSVCFNHIDGVNLNLLYVKGRSDLVLKLELIKKSLSTLVLFASIPFGVVAICLSRVIYSLITLISDAYYTGKFYNYGFLKQVKDVWLYFVLSILSCIPAYAISYTKLPDAIALIIGCTTAITLYYVMLHRNPYMIELVELIKKQVKKK